MKNPEFLKKKYDLHNAPEVEASAKRTKERTGEKVSQDPEARIKNYLDRLEKLVLDPNKEQPRKMLGSETRPRALSLLREMVMNKYVRPNKERMAQGAAGVEERAARDIGIEARYEGEQLAQRGDIAVADLEKSLDNWISYLSDANEPYPTWFRYYAFRNVLDLGDYDKDKKEFTKRSEGTVKLFPDIDRGALAYVEEMIEASKDPNMLDHLQRAQKESANGDIPANELITKEKAANFAKLSFAKQYAEGIKQNGEITPEMREETRGKWVKYQQGTDPTALWSSLQNKGAPWCTKGFATAKTQLNGGDFYVYYTLDKQGNPTIPRIAIRMEGHDKISNDVRGVLDSHQNIEGNMVPILDEKLKEFGSEADRFRKRSSDMKVLTEISGKTKKGEQLTKDELIFLYEINFKIKGFGYQRDPRIEELRKQRNPKEDASIVLDCKPEQIATNEKEINKDTKAYIGPFFNGVFQLNLEHLGTSFPEGMVIKMEAEIGGKDKKELLNELKEKKINISDLVKQMMDNPDFTTSKKPEHLNLVRLKVSSLGFPKGKDPTIDEIYKRIEELGLELCPAETGPNLRLQNSTSDRMYIGMKQIADRGGNPNVFMLCPVDDGLWLSDWWTHPGSGWDPENGFVFVLRK